MQKQLLALCVMIVFSMAFSTQGNAQETEPLPLSTSKSMPQEKTWSIVQQRARFAADQRMLRHEWNQWIGYEPLRPFMNGSYMSNAAPRYYVPARGAIVSSGMSRMWYW